MTSMTGQLTQSLFESLSQKRDCCRALIELSQKQRDLITSGDLNSLLKVLATKQRVMGRMDEVQRRLDALSRDTPRWREDLDRDAQLECQDVLDDMEQLLSELIDIEKECEQKLVQLREAALEQLRQSDAGRELNRAYLTEAAPSTNRLVDLETD